MIDFPQYSQPWIDYYKDQSTLLTAGTHQRTKTFSAEGVQYVLRDMKDGIEFYLMTQAAERGVGPKIIASDPDKKWILMEYISTPTITPEIAGSYCQEIGADLRKAHEIPLFRESGRSFHESYGKKLTFMAAKAEFFSSDLGQSLLTTAEKAKAIFDESMESLSQLNSDLKVNIHTDLHPRNLFWTGREFLIIDWEHATHGHPYFDLATLVILLGLDENQEQELLCGYFGGSPTEPQLSEYALLKKIRWAHTAFLTSYRGLLILAENRENDPILPTKTLKEYMQNFAESGDPGSLDFYYNMSQITLEEAQK